jgi:exonuclease SbcC
VQCSGRRYSTLFSDECDGALDPDRKRRFMAMKRQVLALGGYEREYFISQTPELAAMADAVIDLDDYVVVGCGAGDRPRSMAGADVTA